MLEKNYLKLLRQPLQIISKLTEFELCGMKLATLKVEARSNDET